MFMSLQACRALAATFVLLFHVGGTIALQKYSGVAIASVPFSFGHAGVDLFFVLSGFIICWAHLRDVGRPSAIWRYLAKRVVRIYPLYFVMFGAVYGAALLIPSLAKSVPDDWLVVFKGLFLIPQGVNEAGATGAPVLIVAWSLQYEMLFYLVFALFILSRGIGSIAVLSLLCVYLLCDESSGLPWSFVTRESWLWQFAMGVLVANVVSTARTATCWAILAGASGAVGYSLVAISEVLAPTAIWGIDRHLLYGATSALIVFGVVQLEREGRVVGSTRFIQLLGDSSYALYLTHFPVVSAACKVLKAMGCLETGGSVVASFVLIAGLGLGFAVAVHRWIEVPLLRWGNNVILR